MSAERCTWFRAEVLEKIAELYGLPRRLVLALLNGRPPLDVAYAPMRHGDAGWPVLVFTSGLYGTCEMYTQFCRDLAAAGAIVIALEHEDGSGLFATEAGSGRQIHYMDPPPGVTDGVAFRRPFLHIRAHELRVVASALAAATRGRAEGKGAVGDAVSRVLAEANPERMLLVGHSFGSASILRFLQATRDAPCPYRGAVLADLWPEPLEERELRQGLQVPFALLASEQFARIHSKSYRALVDASAGKCRAAAVVRGARHQWISESGFFAPTWVLRCLGILGTGDFRHVRAATAHAMQVIVEALLDDKEIAAQDLVETRRRGDAKSVIVGFS